MGCNSLIAIDMPDFHWLHDYPPLVGGGDTFEFGENIDENDNDMDD